MAEFDASNQRHVKLQAKQARILDRERREFMGHIMSTTSGRMWIHDKLLLCHVFETSFSSNALNTAFREGERNVGLSLLVDVMTFCPDQYLVMMREANARAAADDARRSRSDEAANRRDSEPGVYVHPAYDDSAPTVSTDYTPGDNEGEDDGVSS